MDDDLRRRWAPSPSRCVLLFVCLLLGSVWAESASATTSCFSHFPYLSPHSVVRFDVKPACRPRPAGKGPKVSAVHGICKRQGTDFAFTGTCLGLSGGVLLVGTCAHPVGPSLDLELRASGPSFDSMNGRFYSDATSGDLDPTDCKAAGLK